MNPNPHVDVASRFARTLFEAFDGEAAATLVTDRFHAHPWAVYGLPDGPEGVRLFAAALRAAFGNARRTVEDVVSEGDKVVVRYVFEADHRGELMGIPATGRRVRIPGIFIARLEGDRLAEYWCEENLLGMVQQLTAGEGVAA